MYITCKLTFNRKPLSNRNAMQQKFLSFFFIIALLLVPLYVEAQVAKLYVSSEDYIKDRYESIEDVVFKKKNLSYQKNKASALKVIALYTHAFFQKRE